MNRLVPSLLVVVALVGCGKNTARPIVRFNGPTDVAAYRGYGVTRPSELRHFIAVANTRGDDLRIIDAVTDQAELSPTLVAALSVPTEPRPSLIAAGRLGDLDTTAVPPVPLARPDLLVVAPSGLVPSTLTAGQFTSVIQLVATWDAMLHVADTVELGVAAPGASMLSLLVTPVLEAAAAGGWQPKAGAARVVAGLSDGRLVLIEASRVPGSEAITLGPPTSMDLGFTPLDLAVTADGRKLYVATTEPIPGPGGIVGVAELDLTAAAPFPIRAIGARAGTTRVAAIDVSPFTSNDLAGSAAKDVFGPAVPRVLAAIDSGSCGRDRSMPCGVAVLDPVAGGLAPDPAGELPYQLPMEVAGEVVDLAASGPPVKSNGFMELAPASGKRFTQAIAAISSSSGRVYVADLSHFALANDLSALNGSTRARVVSTASYSPTQTSNTVGVWAPYKPETATDWPVLVDTQAAAGVTVTPGYTPTDNWSVSYQGVLPGLGGRLAVAQVPAGAPQPPATIALQEDISPPGATTHRWRSVVRVYDPRLAIQQYDIVEVQAADVVAGDGTRSNPCPRGKFEMVVTGILPPTADAPGGALAVVPAAEQPINFGQTEKADATCLPAGATSEVTVAVRAWGFVLVGQAVGYMGRPPEIFADPPSYPPFEVRYENEDALACPILPDSPADWPPSAAAVAACEADVATCRSTCERLVLARRARRIFYVTTRCELATEEACYTYWHDGPAKLTFPLPKGPMLSFKLGVLRPGGGLAPPDRGAFVSIATGSGFSASARVPYVGTGTTGAVLPGGLVLHDRSEATGVATDGIHGFAAFTDNLLLDFAAGGAAQNAVVIR